jgi:hypothetical protein
MVAHPKLELYMKNIFYSLLVLSFVSCSIDNYKMPDTTFSGRVLDNATNEMVENGGVNSGTIIQIFEGTSKQPIISQSYPDGHFVNAALFSGNYRLWAIGAFRMIEDTMNVEITGNKELDIKVLPNLRLSTPIVSITGTTATVKVTFTKVHQTETLSQLAVIWSTSSNPNMYTFAGGNSQVQNVSSEGLTTGERTFTITGLSANKKYYIRVAGRTNAAGNYYNYSKTIATQ